MREIHTFHRYNAAMQAEGLMLQSALPVHDATALDLVGVFGSGNPGSIRTAK